MTEHRTNQETAANQIKNEVSVNDLLEANEKSGATVPSEQQRPHYELDWKFIDKYSIRVTFDLYSLPRSLIESNVYSHSNKQKWNLLGTMTTMPSNSLKSIFSLEYFLFLVRPHHQNREIILNMDKLTLRNTTSRPYPHFSNSLRLTSLNHHEKYSVCICYYQKNSSSKTPDLLLCQDVINNYEKFSDLRADLKHGLVFITTQYSIIIGLLIVLQTVYSIRQRRVTHYITQYLSNTAHNVRTTISSVTSLRQSVSSMNVRIQQQHATDSDTSECHSITDEGRGARKGNVSSTSAVISHPSMIVNNSILSSNETQPFLKRVPSKSYAHLLLGSGNASDEEDDNPGRAGIEIDQTHGSQLASCH